MAGSFWRAARAAIFLCALASAVRAQSPTTRPPSGLREHTPSAHALVNARIVIAPGRVIEGGTLIVRDGLIVDVGEAINCPEDCRRWDLAGKTIYPGLIDAYSEVTIPDSAEVRGPGYWNAQITPQLRAEDHYRPDDGVNAKLRGQGITQRLIVPNRGVIRGTSAVVTTGDDPPARSVVRQQVALHVEPTLRPGRSRDGYPTSPMGALTLVRQAFYDADWHARAWDAHRAKSNVPRPEQNVALEALAEHQRLRRPVVFEAQDELYFLRADRLAAEFGLSAIIRGSGQEYRRIDAIAATGLPVIAPVNFPKAPNVSTPEGALAASLEDLLDWDIAPENPARLEKAGVRFALSAQGLKDTGEFLDAVRRAVERGLSANGALAALTTTPAELLGIADRAGTLERGKAAHLVIADGDLWNKGTKIVATWVDGRRYEAPATPRFDLRGTWEVSVTLADGTAESLVLELTGEPSKLKGQLRRPNKPQADEADANSDKKPEQANDDEQDDKGKDDKADGDKDKEADKKSDKKNGELTRPTLSDALFTAGLDGESLQWPGIVQLSATVLTPWAEEDRAVPPLEMLGRVIWADGAQTAWSARQTKRASDSDTHADQPDAKATDMDTLAEGGKTDDAKPSEPPKYKKEALFAVNYPLGAFGIAGPPEQPKQVLFKDATVWTCGPEGTLEKASVLITDGKIAAISTDITPPEGAVVIDCAGRHLAPGIIDCHSHIATDGGVNESGQAITAEVRIGDFIDSNDVNIYRQLAGGVTTANILHGSANPIGGQNQVIKMRWGGLPEEMKFNEAPTGIKFALGENVKQSNWGERYTSRYPQTRMGVEQLIRDEFHAARAYRYAQLMWRRNAEGLPPRHDLELEAVAEVIEGKRLIHCHSYRQDEILAFMRVCEEFGVRIATLQHILEGYKLADVMKAHGASGSSFSDWWAYKFEVYDAIPYNGALMHQAGVLVSFNSDDAELARRLNLEAAKAVKYGDIPPIEAIKFVTINPAKQLGIDQQVGSIEPGKSADLALWSGPPLSVYSRCEETWVDGRKYFDRAADLARRDQIRKMRADLVQKILLSKAELAEPGEERSASRTWWPREDIYCGHHGHTVDDHMHGF
jgi:N-acetylglucosamine-6-phosphate deacetylase